MRTALATWWLPEQIESRHFQIEIKTSDFDILFRRVRAFWTLLRIASWKRKREYYHWVACVIEICTKKEREKFREKKRVADDVRHGTNGSIVFAKSWW